MRHHRQGHLVHAAAIYRLILVEQPEHPIALQYLGVTAYQNGDLDFALDAIEHSIALKPDVPDFHNNRGLVLQAQGDLEGAIAAYQRAVELNSGYVEAHNNMGLALDAAGFAARAIPCFERAIALQPNFAQAHWNLSISLLATGDFERGWPEYEWRLRTPELAGRAQRFVQPVWDGAALDGRCILLDAEQGFGDSIQFVRYAPMVAARGGKVIVECPPELKRLLETAPGIDQVATRGEPLPAFDLHCAQLSLPARCGTRGDNVPAPIPYFRLKPEWIASWRAKLATTGNFLKVGLVWAGNPDHKNDAHRSILPQRLAPLGAATSVVFFSLQKRVGPIRHQATGLPFPAVDLTEDIGDFADLAALIANLDVVISVDTSVAHLAGAIGKPTWVLLPFAPDWRWQSGRNDSPWYPTMRLFRQRVRGDWDEVLQRVSNNLLEFMSKRQALMPDPGILENCIRK